MWKLQNILLVEWLRDIQIKDKPSLKRFQRVEISGNMDMVVGGWVECTMEFTLQDIFTERFSNCDMTPLGTAIYIGHAGIDSYSGGVEVHINSEEGKKRKL